MAANMNLIVKNCFPRAKRVTDRFHVQKLACEAVPDIRIKHRRETLDAENTAYKKAKFPNLMHSLQFEKLLKKMIVFL